MADTLGQVDILVRGDTAPLLEDFASAKRAAEEFSNDSSKAVKQAVEANKQLAAATEGVVNVYDRLKASMLGVLGVLGIKSILDMADTWSDLNARLRIATGSTEAGADAMERLESVARRTYSSLQQTTESFIYNSRALKDLGYNTKQQLDFSEALNNALVVSGAKAQRSQSVQLALSKAMGLGVLHGQELNTVLSMGGRVAEVIAQKMGVTTNQLKGLGAQGKITSDIIYKSLVGNLDLLRKQADSMPATVQDGMTLMGNAVLGFVGTVDEALGVTDSMAKGLVNLGDQIRGSAVPAANLLKAAVTGISNVLTGWGVSMEAVQGAATALFVGLIGGVAVRAVMSATAAIRGMTIALLANPFVAFAVALTAALVAVYEFRDKIKTAFGIDVVATMKSVANFIIAAFVAGFTTIKYVWQNFPQLMSVFATAAANVAIRGINGMVQASVDGINSLIDLVNSVNIFGQIGKIGPVKLFDELTATTGDLLMNTQAWAAEIEKTKNTDYVGGLMQIASATKEAAKSTEDLDGAVSHAADTMDAKAAKAYQTLLQHAKQFVQNQLLEQQVLGMSERAANAMRYEQDMLNQAVNDNIPLWPSVKAAIHDAAQEMAAAEDQTKKLTDAFNFTKETFRGFIQDFKSGLEQGKGIWESFRDAALNALNKIVDKLLNDVIDAIFQVNKASAGGGGGGGILGSILGLFGLGGGGGSAAPIISAVGAGIFHSGGTVGQPNSVRHVSPLAFAGAQRMHSGGVAGLRSNEVPAILRRGEVVFPSAGAAGGAGGTNVIEIQLQDGLTGSILQEAANTSIKIMQKGISENNSRAARQRLQAG